MKVTCGTSFNKIEVILFAVKADRRRMDAICGFLVHNLRTEKSDFLQEKKEEEDGMK